MTKEAKTTRAPRRKTVALTPEAAQTIERTATDLEMPHKAVTAAAEEIASAAIVRDLAKTLGEGKLREARERVKALELAIGKAESVE